MKRILLTLLVLLTAAVLCTAQTGVHFPQKGMATQEMFDEGLSAAHSSLDIGSKVKVISEDTKKEAIVTITRRMATSFFRIIDLSPAAANALGIRAGGQVTLDHVDSAVSTAPAGSVSSGDSIDYEDSIALGASEAPEQAYTHASAAQETGGSVVNVQSSRVSTVSAGHIQTQSGNATQNMRGEKLGLSAHHSRIPVGSKVKVTNPANNRDIEVTITGHIPESTHRIIDLSPVAAATLGLNTSGPVVLAAPIEMFSSGQDASPFTVTINNYIVSPEPAPQPEPEPEPEIEEPVVDEGPWRPLRHQPNIVMEPDPPAPVLPAPVEPPPPPVAKAPPPEPAPPKSMFGSPVFDVRIIPGLPNPQSKKVYRLLVGVYQGVDNAFPICQQLQFAGFEVVLEQVRDMCRVFAANIHAPMVYFAAQRLGAIGFEQVWIYE